MIDLEVMGNPRQATQISNNKKARYKLYNGLLAFRHCVSQTQLSSSCASNAN